MKEHTLINRLGNKTNDIKSFAKYLPKDVKRIVEPFAGSYAVSQYYYELDNEKYKYVINDTDYDLYYIYTNIDKYIKIRHDIDENTNNYEEFDNYINNYDFEYDLKTYLKRSLVVRGKIFKKTKTPFTPSKKSLGVLKNAKIYNYDYINILCLYEDDKDAFIFLDPPYLFSDNSTYQINHKNDADTSSMIFELYNYMMEAKCKVMLIINKLQIIYDVFRGPDFYPSYDARGRDVSKLKIYEYDKIYSMGQRKATHLIICNYEL